MSGAVRARTSMPAVSGGAVLESLERGADDAADRALAVANDEVGIGIAREIGRAIPPREPGELPASVLQTLAMPGEPIGATLRAEMERRFDHDFSHVRIHAGGHAAASAADVDAAAYTVGHHVVFGGGAFSPSTHEGRKLIAHELAHVVQQAPSGPATGRGFLQRKPRNGEAVPRPLSDADRDEPGVGDLDEASRPIDAAEPPIAPRPVSAIPFSAFEPEDGMAQNSGTAVELGEPEDAIADAQPVVPLRASHDESGMPDLSQLLAEPAESGEHGEFAEAAETGVDLAALLGELASGASGARRRITDHSMAARTDIGERTKSARERVTDAGTKAREAVDATELKRLDLLKKDIRVARDQIDAHGTECLKKANEYAESVTRAQIEGFAFYRKRLGDYFDQKAAYAEKIRIWEVGRIERKTAANSKDARLKSGIYAKRYVDAVSGQSQERRDVQREAASDVAESYAKEIEKAKTEAIPEVNKHCTSLATALVQERDKALLEYDKLLPPVLVGINEQRDAARKDIVKRAIEVRGMLKDASTDLRKRVHEVAVETRKGNRAFLTKVDGQIESAGANAKRQFERAVPEAMAPIAAIVDDAVELVTEREEELDSAASANFVAEVVGFSLDAADASGAVFEDARAATAGTLQRSGPFARRGLAAGRKDLETRLRAEGEENAKGLSKFTLSANDYLSAPLEDLDATFETGVVESGKALTDIVNDARAKLRDGVKEATDQIHQAVNDVIHSEFEAMEKLPKAMHNAARQAAWRYDHPYMKHVVDAVEVTLGFLLIVAILVGIVVIAIAAFGEIAAMLILAVVGGFLAGYFGAKAYTERREKGESRVSALLGALGEITGVNEVRRAFTDSKMAPFERGMAWGGFWLGLFGAAGSASKFFRLIKLRLPKSFTNPFKMKRAPIGEIAPGVTAAKKPIGFELPHQTRAPELPVARDVPAPGPQREIGFLGGEKPARVGDVPDGRTPRREIGFINSDKPARMPDVPDGPSTKREIGFVSSEKPPVARDIDAPRAPDSPPISEMPRAREVPGTRADSAGEVAGPRASANESPGAQTPTKGHVVSTADAPTTPAPVTKTPAPAAAPARQSPNAKLADKRVAESRIAKERATARREAEQAAMDELAKELEFLDELHNTLGDRRGDYVSRARSKKQKALRKAERNRDAARRVEADAEVEALHIERAQQRIRKAEKKLDVIEKKRAALEQNPDPEDPTKFKGQAPKLNTSADRKYKLLQAAKEKIRAQRKEYTKDLTRSLADHVDRMVPGEAAKPAALDNAAKFPGLEPVNGRPIDITTAKPMDSDSWATDHIMSRKEIASDPRFGLLDPQARADMIHRIPENFLPLTKSANSSKGKRSVRQWLASRSGKKDIPSEMRAALRAADAEARKAVEARFRALVGPLE